MKFYEIVFLVFLALWVGCAGWQEAVSPESPQAQATCTTACAAYEFTQCGTEMQRALNVGEFVSSLDTCLEACQKLPGRFQAYFGCLSTLGPNSTCADVEECLE